MAALAQPINLSGFWKLRSSGSDLAGELLTIVGAPWSCLFNIVCSEPEFLSIEQKKYGTREEVDMIFHSSKFVRLKLKLQYNHILGL